MDTPRKGQRASASPKAVSPFSLGSALLVLALSTALGLVAGARSQPTSAAPQGQAVDTGEFCGDWSVSDDSFGRQGFCPEVDNSWTLADLGLECFGFAHFYCFED